jgi:hypothetical protein
MLSRRDVVGKLAAGTAVVCTAGVAGASLTPETTKNQPMVNGQLPSEPIAVGETIDDSLPKETDSGPAFTAAAPQPWDLLHPLTTGAVVAHGWRVAGLTGVTDGSCVVTLQNERGRTNRVHICRNDGTPQGLVYTKNFDLVVMNGGMGDLPTEENFGQAVAELAHVLAANESDRRHSDVVTALLPQAERVRMFAGSTDRRLR